MRDFRERWDPEAPLVWAKDAVLGMRELPNAVAGEPVPKELFDIHRLRIWWNAGFVRKGDFNPERPTEQPKYLGGGWYEVTLPGGKIEKVRGRAKALES
jgi:hypothetical protein